MTWVWVNDPMLASSFLLRTGNRSDSRDLGISASSSSATVWLPSSWENDATDRMVLEGELFCRPKRFFGGRPLVLGGMVGIFLVELESTYRDLWKNDFFEILAIFSGHAKILDHFFWQIFTSFTFGKSARTNRKISLISTYSDGFGLFKNPYLFQQISL